MFISFKYLGSVGKQYHYTIKDSDFDAPLICKSLLSKKSFVVKFIRLYEVRQMNGIYNLVMLYNKANRIDKECIEYSIKRSKYKQDFENTLLLL